MSRASVALVWEAVFFALAFGWRSWLQWRRSGSTGFIRPRRRAPPAETFGAVGFIGSLALMIAAPLADMAGWPRIAALDADWTLPMGVLVAAGGTALTIAAQLAMGESWRVGVDVSARTSLVTSGIFAAIRNPIFTAMTIATVGLVLLVPNWVSVTALVTLVLALEVQVRGVEEPYLTETHGDRYRDYRKRTGRFLPRLGR